MDDKDDGKNLESRPPIVEDLVKVCHSLNQAGAKYLVRCLESSVTDFGNIFHFRKHRPTALNSNIQITNFKLPFLGTELIKRGTKDGNYRRKGSTGGADK